MTMFACLVLFNVFILFNIVLMTMLMRLKVELERKRTSMIYSKPVKCSG